MSRSAWPASVLQSVLHFLASLLEVGFGLVSLTLGTQGAVAAGLAGGLLPFPSPFGRCFLLCRLWPSLVPPWG